MEIVNQHTVKGITAKTIVRDMVYGLGLSVDRKKFEFTNGYKEFVEYLKTIL